MNKAEVMELKKRFKYSDCSFSGYSYVTIENNENGRRINSAVSDKFLTQEDAVQKKYLSLIGKAYSSAGGAFAEDIKISGDDKKLLMALAMSQEPDAGLIKTFAEKIMENYDTDESYALIVFTDAYDVPVKDTAKIRTGESEEVYNYIAACICPFKPSDGGIIMTEDKKLAAADVFRKLSAPVAGFIYPAFNDRSSDYDHMYTVVKQEPERELIRRAYNADVPGFEKVKKTPKKEVKEVIEQEETFSGYSEYLEEHISMSKGVDTSIRQNTDAAIYDDLPSSDTYEIKDSKIFGSTARDNNTESKNEELVISGNKDIVSMPVDHIVERDVNGVKFFMVPEKLISYEKLMALIEDDTNEE